MLEVSNEAWLAILLVSAITFGSRLAGAALMRSVAVSPTIERFLDALAVSVIAALVASILAQSDLRSAAAVALAAVITLTMRSAVWAMVAGMAAAAIWTNVTLSSFDEIQNVTLLEVLFALRLS